MAVYILTEANSIVGFGHLMRCLSFYKEFESNAWNPIFILDIDHSTKTILENCRFVSVPWLSSPNELRELITSEDVLFIDSISVEQTVLDYLRHNVSKKYVVIDDYLRRQYHNSIIIDWTANVENSDKHKHNLIDNKLLLGIGYSVLRKPFIDGALHGLNKDIENILITMGGADVRKLTEPLVNYLSLFFPNINFRVVIGSGFAAKEFKEHQNVTYCYSLNDLEISQLMKDSDICVAAAGQTLYELVALGVPAIAVEVVDNQKEDIKGLKELGILAGHVVWDNKNLLSNVQNKIEELKCVELREHIYNRSKSLRIGKGMPLILEEIKKKFNI